MDKQLSASEHQNAQIQKYLDSLNSSEKKAYEIAKTKLESSFDIQKSIGFLEFMKSQKS